MSKDLFYKVCGDSSKLITKSYSTSFSLGIKMFAKRFRQPIYDIYGFVRFADEIVDTFHNQPQELLLAEFKEETQKAIDRGFSTNPVLQSFQRVVRDYSIDWDLIDSFLTSMAMDLNQESHSRESYDKYVYGSAEVVGLMCLKVFVEGDDSLYRNLESSARSLGAAFQKVNFLRDMKSDFEERGRIYFPQVSYKAFSQKDKSQIEAEIQADFDHALVGINKLPAGSKRGVKVAYVYFERLLAKIRSKGAESIKEERIRVSNTRKMGLLFKTLIQNGLKPR